MQTKAFFQGLIYVNRWQASARFVLIFLCSFFIVQQLFAGDIKFIPNKGQWPANIQYKADVPGGIFFVKNDTLTYYFYDGKALHDIMHDRAQKTTVKSHVIKIGFVGSAGARQILETGAKSTEYYNYFIGNNPANWASKVYANETILLKEIWPGIDLEITSFGSSLKYNFHVAPKADPSQIKLAYEGAAKLTLQENRLNVETNLGTVTEDKPVSYQQTRKKYLGEVETSYILNDNILSFDLGSYNRKKPLIIDPIVVFATFSGSVADNFGFTATYNHAGNAFSGGTVYSAGFPTTAGAFQTTFQGGFTDQTTFDWGRDCGILKYSPDGKQLIWATYLGGKDHNDQPHSMVVNSKGDLLILGSTHSATFPTTFGAYDRSYNGSGDIFISKLSADGSTLLSSTFLGGTGRDGLNGSGTWSYDVSGGPLAYNYGDEYRGEVIVDEQDNVLIATCTQSDDFPVSGSSFQNNFGGWQDGCVAKFSSNLNNLSWCTYIGGSSHDAAYGVNVDRNGNLVICGGTTSQNFFTTPNAAFKTPLGDVDGFIVKLSPAGNICYSSTLIGTGAYDQAYFVQIDDANRIYVTGQTRGAFPVIGNVYRNPNSTQYIAMLENDLSAIIKSTVFGSGRNTVDFSPSAFLVDLCGRICVSGWGGDVNRRFNFQTGFNFNMPVTGDAYQPQTQDGSDFYLIILSKEFGSLVYGSYFGGPNSDEHVDGGTSRFDRDGKVYQSVCGGCGGHSDFPTTPGAWSRTNKGKRPYNPAEGGCNNALFKIDLNSSNFAPEFKDTTLEVIATNELRYSFKVTDRDLVDSVYITYNSKIFDSKNIPAPVATASAINGVGQGSGELIWQTACEHISNDTYYVQVIIRDNGCPTPRVTIGTIKIVVKAPPIPAPPAIFCLNRIDDHTLNLSWDEYQTDKYLKSYKLIKQWPDGKIEELKTFDTQQDKFYSDNNAPGHLTNDYCYFIYGISICDTNGDTTRKICSIPDEDSIPRAVWMYTVSVENNDSLRVIWNKYQKDDFYQYFLYKKENKSGSSYKLVQIFKNVNDTSFADSDVDVHKQSYCYKVIVKNQCGLFGRDSSYGCSILLKGQSVPFEHHLSWNGYELWRAGVQKYDIIRRDAYNPADLFVGKTPGGELNFIDDSLNYDVGLYWYKVVGFEGIGGKGAKSVSNEIELIQAPHLYVPNAFTPNDDSTNDVFNALPVFVKDYHLKIFNRWGEFVWETSNKKEMWDAYYNGKYPFNNVFIWQVEYTGWDKSRNWRHGYITVLP